MLSKIKTLYRRIQRMIVWLRYDILFQHVAKKVRPDVGERGLFIDCGSNLGQGFNYFKKYFRNDIYDSCLIEPNPYCMVELRKKFSDESNISFIQKAAWVRKEQLNFYGLVEDSRGKTTTGGSVIANHAGSLYRPNTEKALKVEAFDLSEFLKEKSQLYDTIVVKMDIESSEYEVLNHLLVTNAIDYVNHLVVEFHSQYFAKDKQGYYSKLEQELITRIKSRGTGLTVWI